MTGLAGVEVHGVTRQAFMLRGMLAATAAYGAAAAGPFVARALAQDAGTSDQSIAQFALTLEVLEATYYREAVKKAKLSGEVLAVAKDIRDNEIEHVDILTDLVEQLGGRPRTSLKLDFGDALNDSKSFLRLAQTFEDTGVSAYNGAAPNIQSPDVLEAAGQIVQIEARHAAMIRFLNDQDIAPGAFDRTRTEKQVLAAVDPYIRGSSG